MKLSKHPNSRYSKAELMDYIRKHKLNQPEIRLAGTKAQLQAALKKHGHWRNSRTPNQFFVVMARARIQGDPTFQYKNKTYYRHSHRHPNTHLADYFSSQGHVKKV